jgi:phage tail sheath gpL-like
MNNTVMKIMLLAAICTLLMGQVAADNITSNISVSTIVPPEVGDYNIQNITFDGVVEEGDTYTITIDGETFTYVVLEGDTLETVLNNLLVEMEASTLASTIEFTVENDTLILTSLFVGNTIDIDILVLNYLGVPDEGAYTITVQEAQDPIAPTAQVDEILLTGSVETGDVYTISIDGTPVDFTVTDETTMEEVAEAMALVLNAQFNGVIIAAAENDTITLTAVNAGVEFITVVTVVNFEGIPDETINHTVIQEAYAGEAPVAQETVITISEIGIDEHDLYVLDVDGYTVNYTAQQGDTAYEIIQGLVNAANAHTQVSALVSASVDSQSGILFEGVTPGYAFVAAVLIFNYEGTDDQSASTMTINEPEESIDGEYQITSVNIGSEFDAGDTFIVDINGEEFTHVATTGDTVESIRDAFIYAINANANVNTEVEAEVETSSSFTVTGLVLGDIIFVTADTIEFEGVDDQELIWENVQSELGLQNQIHEVVVSGTVETGDMYQVMVQGQNQIQEAMYTVQPSDNSYSDIVAGVVDAVNNHPVIGNYVEASQESSDTVQLEVLQAGTDITVTATTTNADGGAVDNAFNQITVQEGEFCQAYTDRVIIAGTIDAGDIYTVDINGNSYVYVAQVGDAEAEVLAGLAVAISADSDVDANVEDADSILITALVGCETFVTVVDADNVPNLFVADIFIQLEQAAVTPYAGEAQVDKVTISGTVEKNDAYTVSVDGNSATYIVEEGDTQSDIISGLVAALNADSSINSIVTASYDANNMLLLTANEVGEAFTSSAWTENTVGENNTDALVALIVAPYEGEEALPQLTNVEIGGTVETGDYYCVDIDQTTVGYTVQASDNQADVIAGLTQAVNSENVDVNATVLTSNEMQLQGLPGESYTVDTCAINTIGIDDQGIAFATLVIFDPGYAGQSQIDEVHIQGTPEEGDVYTVTVNTHTVTYEVQNQDTHLDIVDALASSINSLGNTTVEADVVNNTMFTITDDVGVEFTTSASAQNVVGIDDGYLWSVLTILDATPAQAQVDLVEVTGPVQENSVFFVTVENTTASYVSQSGDTANDVIIGLTTALNLELQNHTAEVDSSNTLTITANAPAVPFETTVGVAGNAVYLTEGINFFALPKDVLNASVDHVFRLFPNAVAYRYETENESWVALSGDDELTPVEGYVVVNSQDGFATFTYAPSGYSVPETKTLFTGWNLVGNSDTNSADLELIMGSNNQFGYYNWDHAITYNEPAQTYNPFVVIAGSSYEVGFAESLWVFVAEEYQIGALSN